MSFCRIKTLFNSDKEKWDLEVTAMNQEFDIFSCCCCKKDMIEYSEKVFCDFKEKLEVLITQKHM